MPAASMDQRAALPLLAMMAEHQKQNMREHLMAVQGIVAAISRDDMDGVAKAAGRIGYSEAMGQMCEHMGAAAPGFTERALDFHRTADAPVLPFATEVVSRESGIAVGVRLRRRSAPVVLYGTVQ